MVQLSHLYMTTGKTIALTLWIFVGKVMSLPFIRLSRFVLFKNCLKDFNFMEIIDFPSQYLTRSGLFLRQKIVCDTLWNSYFRFFV